jgi:hypothetical protein
MLGLVKLGAVSGRNFERSPFPNGGLISVAVDHGPAIRRCAARQRALPRLLEVSGLVSRDKSSISHIVLE